MYRKSSYSSPAGANCVEVDDDHPHGHAVRDSKDPDGAFLVLSTAAWATFTAGIRGGEFDG